MFNGHEIKHDCENPLLHFPGVFGTKNDHFLSGKVDGDRSARGHTCCVPVCGEGAGVVDCKVGRSVGLHLFIGRTNQHVSHEETVVCSCTDDTDFDSVTSIPASIAVKDVDSGTGVEVVDGSFTVDFPDCFWHRLIDRTPPDILRR